MEDERMEELREQITDDSYAERVVNRLKDAIEERDRLIKVCKDQIDSYQNKINEITDEYANRISYNEEILRAYFETVKVKETDTQKSYKLPSGTLKLTKAKKDYEPDKEKLLEYLKANATEYVKVKEEPMWGEFKKTLSIVGDNVVTDTGEVIDCVEVILKPESFTVK